MPAQLQFLGAAGTVTGSKFLLSFAGKNILIDCGLFQGFKNLRLKNWNPLPISPREIDAVILTHAHIDHSGYLPRLVKDGFCGPIFSTEATKDVCKLLLPDSGYLLEEEANYLNRTGRSKHKPAIPLFNLEEAKVSLKQFESIPFHETKTIGPGLSFHFRYAGHILGAASVIVQFGDRKIAFSGDVGRLEDDIFYPPEPLPPVDYLVTESTYGNSVHGKTKPLEEIQKIISECLSRNGVIVLPAFAVGRAQSLMYYLSILKKQGKLPGIPIFLNSPMATNFNTLFLKHQALHKLSKEQCQEINDVVQFVKTPDESKALNERKGPMIIISASGMLTGGRILHHLKAFAWDTKNTILLTGFQAPGTRGYALEHGAQEVKIHGEMVTVRAAVKVLDTLSAHADYLEMLSWLKQPELQPKKVFVVHGEPTAADDFRHHLMLKFNWDCYVPEHNERVELD